MKTDRKSKAAWTRRTHLFRADEYLCSACGAAVRRPAAQCPSCGAHMRGEKYDPSWVDEAELMDIFFGD